MRYFRRWHGSHYQGWTVTLPLPRQYLLSLNYRRLRETRKVAGVEIRWDHR